MSRFLIIIFNFFYRDEFGMMPSVAPGSCVPVPGSRGVSKKGSQKCKAIWLFYWLVALLRSFSWLAESVTNQTLVCDAS